MASKAAQEQAQEIIQALNLEQYLPSHVLDNLKGRIAAACDKAWNEGFEDYLGQATIDRVKELLKQ